MFNSIHHLINLTLTTARELRSLLIMVLFSLITAPVLAQDAPESDLVEQPATRQVQDHKSPEKYYTVETHLGFGVHRVMSDHTLTYDLIEILATTDSYVMLDEVSPDELANRSPLFIITPPTSLAAGSADKGPRGDTESLLTATTIIDISLDDLIDLYQQLEYLKSLNQTYGYTLNQTNHFLYSLFQALHLHVIHHGLTADDEEAEAEDLLSDTNSEMETTEDSSTEVTAAPTGQEQPEITADGFTLTHMLDSNSSAPQLSEVSIDYGTGGQLMEILGGLASFNFITSSLDYLKDPATGVLTMESSLPDGFVALVAYTQLAFAELTEPAGSVMPHAHLAAFYVSIDDWLSEANQTKLATLADQNLGEFIAKINAILSAEQLVDATHDADAAQASTTAAGTKPNTEPNVDITSEVDVKTDLDRQQADVSAATVSAGEPPATAALVNPTAPAAPESPSLITDEASSASTFSPQSQPTSPEAAADASTVPTSSCLYVANPKHEEFINGLPAPTGEDDHPMSFKEYRQNQLSQQQRYEHLLAFEPKVIVATQILLQEYADANIHITPGSGKYQQYTKVCAL